MYLTAGQYKGTKIDVPNSVKPTLSKVRESIFNMLLQFELEDNSFLDMFCGSGIMGMEAVYTTNSSAEERDSRVFAKENGLLISGGSDYHGEAKPRTDLGMGFGDLYVDASIWTDLKNAQTARDAKL